MNTGAYQLICCGDETCTEQNAFPKTWYLPLQYPTAIPNFPITRMKSADDGGVTAIIPVYNSTTNMFQPESWHDSCSTFATGGLCFCLFEFIFLLQCFFFSTHTYSTTKPKNNKKNENRSFKV